MRAAADDVKAVSSSWRQERRAGFADADLDAAVEGSVARLHQRRPVCLCTERLYVDRRVRRVLRPAWRNGRHVAVRLARRRGDHEHAADLEEPPAKVSGTTTWPVTEGATCSRAAASGVR
jgi:hypothetical protein